MIINTTCEALQQLLKLTKSDVSVVAKDKIYLIAETEPKELSGNRVMIIADGEIVKPGQTIISRSVLNNMSKNGPITIDKNTIKCGTRIIKFKENFETLVPMDIGEKFLRIPNNEFEKALDIEYAVAQDETRPILKSVFIDQDNFVSLDGFRLAMRKHDIKTELNDFNIIIPSELINIYKKIKSKEDLNFYIKDNFITLEIEDIQISIRQIEGSYIRYNSLLPNEHKLEVITDSKELLELLKSYKDIKLVTFDIKDDHIAIRAKNEEMEIEDKISADVKGEGFEISFNIKYLIDSLKHYEDDVIFELNNAISPMVVTNDEEKIDLVLPVKKLS
ncbi:MAG: hypothetical protein E7206_17895 [Clostridium beijerinckii]|nr:hypothetical protein [Clostridium beijerinckii]